MTENDYVILVDENGTPYIAHAFGDRIKTAINRRKNHKYIQRFDNYWGPGKHAYAYTNAEVKLYSAGRRAKNAVKDTARKAGRFVDAHDAGLTERMQANRLNRKAKKAESQGKSGAAAQYRREAKRLQSESQQEYDRSGVKKAADTINKYGATSMNAVRGAAKKAGRRVGQFVDDHDMGITERIQANRMSKRARELESEGRLTLDGAERNKTMAAQLYREAGRLRAQGRQEYENSIVGKAGNAAKNAASSATAAVKNAGKSAVTTIKEASNESLATFNKVSDQIGNKIEQVSGKAAKREFEAKREELVESMNEYNTAAQKYATLNNGKGNNVGAVMKAEKEMKAAEEKMRNLEVEFMDLQDAYLDTPYHQAEKIGLAIDDLVDGVQGVFDGIKENRRVKNALKTGERSGR